MSQFASRVQDQTSLHPNCYAVRACNATQNRDTNMQVLLGVSSNAPSICSRHQFQMLPHHPPIQQHTGMQASMTIDNEAAAQSCAQYASQRKHRKYPCAQIPYPNRSTASPVHHSSCACPHTQTGCSQPTPHTSVPYPTDPPTHTHSHTHTNTSRKAEIPCPLPHDHTSPAGARCSHGTAGCERACSSARSASRTCINRGRTHDHVAAATALQQAVMLMGCISCS